MKIKVIIFDLDDTLYNEIEFVHSGFREVAKRFSKISSIDEDKYYSFMLNELKMKGRGKVFDNVLKTFNLYSKKNVKKSISFYRTHIPNINLPKESIEILTYFKNKNIPIYIVTDGNKLVQANKIKALKLDKFVSKSFITHRYGKIHAKPSTYCFEKIAKTEDVNFKNIVYIADNVNKDFINIKKLGFQTIRIQKGMFKEAIRPIQYHAKYEIDNIIDLRNLIKTEED